MYSENTLFPNYQPLCNDIVDISMATPSMTSLVCNLQRGDRLPGRCIFQEHTQNIRRSDAGIRREEKHVHKETAAHWTGEGRR